MPKFTYVSRDIQGQRITAVADAQTRQGLLTELKDRGLTVVEIKELSERLPQAEASRKKFFTFRLPSRGVNSGELAIFWREFATMVGAGLPIVDALQSITEELEHDKLQTVLKDIIAHMWEGFNFSQSIAKHPRIFSPMVTALMAAAEESGSLTDVSNHLANFLENRDRLIHKVRAALSYPVFLCAFFCLVILVSTFWIIPKFRDIYSGFGAKLPWLTETVFALNAFVLSHFIWIALGFVSSLTALVLWARQPLGREAIDRVSLKLPIFGKLLQRAAVARFCRSLAILLTGGIPINRALEMSQETAGNRVLARAIRKTREEIMQGGKVAVSLKEHSVFPKMAIRMISAGEETGSLSSLLEKIADFYEARVDAALMTINALIEPIFIVLIGLFVLVFILSLYLPIFSLGAAMR